MANDAVFDEVDRNYEVFVEQLPELLHDHAGEFALLHDRNIITFFPDALTAMLEGSKRFGRDRFSVQEVTIERDNLGFYSYVGVSGQA